MSSPIATPATTGAKTATNATLLINSVIKSIKQISIKTIINTLKFVFVINSVTDKIIPVSDIAFARDRPPPNNNNIPQERFLVSFHFKTKS